MEVRAGAATHSGMRERNEDAYAATSPVFAVADGMGGHAGGAEAAAIVAEELARLAGRAWLEAPDVLDAVERASERVAGLAAGAATAPGSTLSGVALAEQGGMPCWLVFNIGDSRTYRLQHGRLEQVTVDHTRVQEMVDAGRLTMDQARTHAERNVITRAIGAGTTGPARLDWSLLVAGPSDRLLVCSDGLTGELSEQLIAAHLLDVADPQQAADALVAEAVVAGGRDNVTAVVVDVVELLGGAGVAGADGTNPDLRATGLEGGDTVPDALLPGQDDWS
jgi:protein phosphatase